MSKEIDYAQEERIRGAAPEMYAALRSMLEHAEWSAQQGRLAFDGARLAIAKAEGRSA